MDFCETAPWKKFMWNVWKFELCLKVGKHKKWKQLPKVPEAQVHGWVHTWQIEISNTTFLLSRNFLPLFLETGWIWIWDLRDIYNSNVLNDGGFLWKGAMEKFYVKCVEIWTLSQGWEKQKIETTAERAWSTSVWLGSHLAVTKLSYAFQN